MSTTNDILLGLGLVIVLALGCELIATRTRLPAIVLLLPAGFIAGAAPRRPSRVPVRKHLSADPGPLDPEWEGVLIDPIGALLGVLVFTALEAHAAGAGNRGCGDGILVRTRAREGRVSGANKILPISFMAIFGTVAIYGLTVAPVARRLGVGGTAAIVVLVVGGHNWARSIAAALKAAGVGVRLWTGQAEEQTAARVAGIDAGNARLGVERAAREAELEEITDALLLTGSDNFNALAAYELRQELGQDHVFRLARQVGAPERAPGPRARLRRGPGAIRR